MHNIILHFASCTCEAAFAHCVVPLADRPDLQQVAAIHRCFKGCRRSRSDRRVEDARDVDNGIMGCKMHEAREPPSHLL